MQMVRVRSMALEREIKLHQFANKMNNRYIVTSKICLSMTMQIIILLTNHARSKSNEKLAYNKLMARQGISKALLSSLKSLTKMCDFSDRENIQRLPKCLKGEARYNIPFVLFMYSNVPPLHIFFLDFFVPSQQSQKTKKQFF